MLQNELQHPEPWMSTSDGRILTHAIWIINMNPNNDSFLIHRDLYLATSAKATYL